MAGCHVARNFVCLVPDSYQNAAMSYNQVVTKLSLKDATGSMTSLEG